MATYRGIATTETDPQAPVTSALMKALEANPTAIAEGATGAPRVFGKALGQTFLGGGVMAGTTPVTWLNLDGMETIKIDFSFASTTNGVALQVDFSNNNGSTWAGYQTLISAHGHTSASGGSGNANVNLRTGAVNCAIAAVLAAAGNYNSATLTPVSNCNALRIRWSTGGGQGAVNAWCLGGREA